MQTGLYEHLMNAALKKEISSLGDPRLVELASIDSEESHAVIAQYLERLIASGLSLFRGADGAKQQNELAERILNVLADALPKAESETLKILNPLQRLLAVHKSLEKRHLLRPDSPLSRSTLFTGTRLDASLGSQLRKELASCDRVDILCSFIKWSGLRVLLDEVRALGEQAVGDEPTVRIITTSYMGATDPKAIEVLREMPGVSIRVSYDTKRTRLHAKAYLFHRKSGFGSAYVGSANLSNAALSEGLEWTTKFSQYELSYLWDKIAGTFDTYWQDEEFRLYDEQAIPRLRAAIESERNTGSSEGSFFSLDLRPFPFQEEILDVIAAERSVQGRNRHLVVAATGTGKTMIAAFDYARFSRQQGRKPRLLFVAHRKEILAQALASYRHVLRDQNFGDLLVDGANPEQLEHLFCSIQSFNSRLSGRFEADRFDYIVVDEFHHAAAPSYQRLLAQVQPKVLLGLTATPERSDQLDILKWFDGRTSCEIRLPDAISRRLLCPFQYFGIADSVNLDGLVWQRGGYRVDELDRLYTGNDIRAKLVFDKFCSTVLNPREVRAVGFCCSVAHAEFMARYFQDHGIPSMALSSQSSEEERSGAQQRLRQRSVNVIFVVDLYNEGVDIPEIDTVLFLRPTESLTVFLQQLGRGLRIHSEKECLTVLDFIGAQRREFRFASRFQALSAKPTAKLEKEIESGFPHLPSGCVVKLERVAQQRVLANVREAIQLNRPRLVASLRELSQYLGRAPTLKEAIDYFDTPLDELLKRGLWSRMLADAGLIKMDSCPDEEQLAKGLVRVCHLNVPRQIECLLAYLESERLPDGDLLRVVEMLLVSLWGQRYKEMSFEQAVSQMWINRSAVDDLVAVLKYRSSLATELAAPTLQPNGNAILALHGAYTRDEILTGLGHWTFERRPDQREGVLHLKEARLDILLVTLQKSEDEYSPTTMYEDYLISPELFHWQSQSSTSESSHTGQRYIHHAERGYTPLLFVRETKSLPSGMSAPYYFLGPCSYVSHTGSKPMSIVWRLKVPVPVRLMRGMARQVAI
jgi:superfamily II DNA or RNA helicase